MKTQENIAFWGIFGSYHVLYSHPNLFLLYMAPTPFSQFHLPMACLILPSDLIHPGIASLFVEHKLHAYSIIQELRLTLLQSEEILNQRGNSKNVGHLPKNKANLDKTNRSLLSPTIKKMTTSQSSIPMNHWRHLVLPNHFLLT